MKLSREQIRLDLYDCLNGNVATGTVHNEVKQGTAYPYHVVGEMQGTWNGSKTHDGQDVTATIHSWSSAPSDLEINGMMDDETQLITAYTWTLTGFTVKSVRPEFDTVIEDRSDADRPLRHGVLRIRIRTHEQ